MGHLGLCRELNLCAAIIKPSTHCALTLPPSLVLSLTDYVYYLVTEHSPGEGFGVATSADGVHWKDHGYVFHGPSWTKHHWWEGTGSVYRAPDYKQTGRYLINWSQDPGKFQNITFGESYDLIHWQPIDIFFNIDTRFYKGNGRWDCIYSLPTPQTRGAHPNAGSTDGYPRYGFWTASPYNNTPARYGGCCPRSAHDSHPDSEQGIE